MSISKFGLILLFLIALLALEYFRVRQLILTSQKLVAKSKPYEQSVSNPTLNVTFLGDSTAVGTGVSDPRLSLAGRLGQTLPKAKIDNQAKNGLLSSQLLDQVQANPVAKQDLVVIHIGGNDIIRLKDLDQSAANIKEILDLLAPLNKQLAVYTTGDMGEVKLFPSPTRPLYGYRSKRLRGLVKEISKDYPNVIYVDLFNQPQSLRSVSGYAADKLHLNENGYALWFQALGDAFKGSPLLSL